MNIDQIIHKFGSYKRIIKCSTQEGSFDKCQSVTRQFIEFADRNKFEAFGYQVAGYKGDPTVAHPKYREIDPSVWHHYLIRVGDVYIDWAFRQFDPNAQFPLLLSEQQLNDLWGKSYLIFHAKIK